MRVQIGSLRGLGSSPVFLDCGGHGSGGGDWNMLTQALGCLADNVDAGLEILEENGLTINHEFSSVIGKKPYYKLESIKNKNPQFSY